MAKWELEAEFTIYVFFYYNFPYIIKSKFLEVIKPYLEWDNNERVIGFRFRRGKSINQFIEEFVAFKANNDLGMEENGKSTPGSTSCDSLREEEEREPQRRKKKKKSKRLPQFNIEYFKKLYDFFKIQNVLGDEEEEDVDKSEKKKTKRILNKSSIRCKTSKIFNKYIGDWKEGQQHRLGNGQILFEDFLEIYLKNQDTFHCSNNFENVITPLPSDTKKIKEQLKKFLKVDYEVETHLEMKNHVLNGKRWGEYLLAFYPLYIDHLTKMEYAKEIFKRNGNGRTKEKIIQHASFVKEFTEIIEKVEKILHYSSAEYYLLNQNPEMRLTLNFASEQRDREISESRRLRKELELTKEKLFENFDSGIKQKSSELKKRKPKRAISRFSVTGSHNKIKLERIEKKTIKEEYIEPNIIQTEFLFKIEDDNNIRLKEESNQDDHDFNYPNNNYNSGEKNYSEILPKNEEGEINGGILDERCIRSLKWGGIKGLREPSGREISMFDHNSFYGN